MKRRFFKLFSLFAALSLILTGLSQPAAAQDDQPPASQEFAQRGSGPADPTEPYQNEDGLWIAPQDRTETLVPEDTGGPDDFGYVWDDTFPLTWIDVSGGTDAGIDDYNDHSDPIEIGFDFKYYEHTYSQLIATRYGYVSFDLGTSWFDDQARIPSPTEPNDVVAPLWSPIWNVSPGYVRYMTAGDPGSQYFVLEWHQLGDPDAGESYTFELILHENGDIVFQYQMMESGYYCQSSGIEDATGTDGLSTTTYCYNVQGYHAVKITRPPADARLKFVPRISGQFAAPSQEKLIELTVTNTGDLGADTYDIITDSSWGVNLYQADGVTPLGDTDGDMIVDTGVITQGLSVTLMVGVTAPDAAQIGDADTVLVTGVSSINTDQQRTARLEFAVPTSFASAYNDDNFDAQYKPSLYLVKPGNQSSKLMGFPWLSGNDLAVEELPNGNILYLWRDYRCLGDYCEIYVQEIYYSLVNPYGEIIRTAKLADLSGATEETHDTSVVAAAAPGGNTGVVWYRDRYAPGGGYSINSNVYFAVINASGSMIAGPANVTNNNMWGDPGAVPDVPYLYNPHIAATGDNRFVFDWNSSYLAGNCTYYDCSINNVYYSIRSSTGSIVVPPTQLTNDVPSDSPQHNSYSTVTSLSGSRVLVSWGQYMDGQRDIAYVVMDSSGSIVKSKTLISRSGSDYRPDTVQLSNGNILVAWDGYQNSMYYIFYALLDPGSYNVLIGPYMLANPYGSTGGYFVSVTRDSEGRGILSWMDYDVKLHLYYALIDSSGSVLTQPMIYLSAPQDDFPYIETSTYGSGITSYGAMLAEDADTYVDSTNALAAGEPGEIASLPIAFGNHGLALAEDVTLTATLDADLTYLGDTLGITPTIAGNVITWNLGDLNFLDRTEFVLYAGIPGDAVVGTLYPFGLEIQSSSVEANPADNQLVGDFMAALVTYLPLILK